MFNSHRDPRVRFGNILNQVQNVYNEFGQQTDSYQAHDVSVNVATTPVVRFNYYYGGGNRIRIAGMTYPNGRDLTYDYGTANGMNDACSRIESIINDSDSLNLVAYQYLGTSGFVNAASSQPGINWTLYGTTNDPNTGDIYSGLDRFGRVDNCLWKQSTTTLAQIQYGYDRASNRTWRKDGVLTGYDELYSYDGLYRLNDQKHGTLNGTQTAITSGTFEQQWGLDSTGNWKTFKQDNDGNGTWELNQTRTANKANEITGITNSVGAAWATPTYDPAGNMIGVPNPQLLTAEYDAWNRLVSIKNGTTKISENVYDARGDRIRKDTYTSGTLTEVRHYYYTPGWQCVEERVGTSTTLERQFVWGLRYIDDLVLRDRSTANNGTINERRYAMQDGNWNTIAICDITGSVGERYAYSAYGTPVFMTGAGVVQSSSPIGFETLYAGYKWDGTTPQMYHVRNRFLLPMIGTWNKRDPLGYVDGMNLIGLYLSLNNTDPTGLICQQSNPCPKAGSWKPSDCNSAPGTDGVDCKCDATSNPPLSSGFPIGEIGNGVNGSNDKLGVPAACNIKFIVGTATGVPDTARTCARIEGNGKLQVYIFIEAGTTLCAARILLVHELVHAGQYCRKGIHPSGDSPNGNSCEETEETAYKNSCEAASDFRCCSDEKRKNCDDPNETRAKNVQNCINKGKALSCTSLPQQANNNGLQHCSDVFKANGI